MIEMENIIKDPLIKIKAVIIPIRDFKSSALSRVKHNNIKGGLWNAVDEETQIQFYKDILSNYIYIMTKYDINTIFIDFEKMINDKNYLFNKIKFILDENNIDFHTFCNVYDEVSINSSPNSSNTISKVKLCHEINNKRHNIYNEIIKKNIIVKTDKINNVNQSNLAFTIKNILSLSRNL